jgi:hypothetical protein
MKALSTQIENLIDNSQYNEAVNILAESFNLEFKTEFLENGLHFQGDKETRDIYNITLKRGQRKYTFKFGQSLNKSGFYAKQGNCITQLDRKYLSLKNTDLYFKVRTLSKIPFNSICDTISKPITPTLYDVLTCLQKYDVGTFENFCSGFGYDTDSRTAKKTYKAVAKEYDKMCSLFSNDELEVLQLIN